MKSKLIKMSGNLFNLYYKDEQNIKYVKLKYLFFSVLLFTFFFMGLFFKELYLTSEIGNYFEREVFVFNLDNEDDFSEELLVQYIKDLNIKFPHVVLAQAKLETGNYSSRIFQENNNLFGMKEASVRCHTSLGTQYKHAFYQNWRESVLDYALYQSTYLSTFKTEKQYYRYLDRSYAESGNYSETLKTIVERENLSELFLKK